VKFDVASVNWLAVLVSGVVAFVLGGFWYTVVFGKLWRRLHGYSDEKVKQMQANVPPPVFLGLMLVCYLVVAAVLAILFASFGVTTATAGAMTALLIWVGPAAAIGLTGLLASDKPFPAFVIDAAFQFVFLVMMGAILGGWR
jgi:hypothetical protein